VRKFLFDIKYELSLTDQKKDRHYHHGVWSSQLSVTAAEL